MIRLVRSTEWIDTHAHLADEALSARLEEVLPRAMAARVTRILCVGVDAEASASAVSLATREVGEQTPAVWASVGIHPNYAHQEKPGDWESIVELTTNARVCALGETGLDRYWDDCPFEVQKANFARHWELSRRTGLPVIIHSRDCDAEMLEALRQEYSHGPLRGVMHSFSSTLGVAMECVEMGLYISFSGMLTYKKNEALRDVAAKVPEERLLVETDCPYLSPEPKRSSRPNEPSLMVHTGEILAQVRGWANHEAAEKTTVNALRLFQKMR
ncbi:MAG: TatD family hydrolase [Pirellula sp.]